MCVEEWSFSVFNAVRQWRTQEFCSVERGGSTNSAEDRGQREWGSGGSSPLVRGSGGSCNLVKEISFHTVKFLNFWYFKTIYDDNQFVIANVKQLST